MRTAMKKILPITTAALLFTNMACAESIKITTTDSIYDTNTESTIETGDSELQYIIQNERPVSFFVGANIIAAAPFYTEYDFLNDPFGFGWGIDAGIKFRKNKYIYHPGIKFSYQQVNNSGDFDIGYMYDYIDLNVSHNTYFVSFENHIRIAYNEPSIFGGYNVNDFFVFGVGIGKINSEYELANYTTNKIKDKGDIFVLNLGYYSQFDNGLGIVLDTKYYFPNNQTVSAIMTIELGLRYAF